MGQITEGVLTGVQSALASAPDDLYAIGGSMLIAGAGMWGFQQVMKLLLPEHFLKPGLVDLDEDEKWEDPAWAEFRSQMDDVDFKELNQAAFADVESFLAGEKPDISNPEYYCPYCDGYFLASEGGFEETGDCPLCGFQLAV